MRQKITVVCSAVAVLGFLGCILPLEPDGVSRTLKPAAIQFYGDTADVIAPASVVAGEPFDVTVRSFGGGCVSFGETRASVSQRIAEIRPYDQEVTHAPRNYACPDILVSFSHTVTLVFNERGRNAALDIREK